MVLRARHLLCALGNLQEWYSKDSLKTIQHIADSFLKNSHIIIQLKDECDTICSSCQHCILNHCQERDKSYIEYKDIDNYIITQCELDMNINYRLSEVIRRMYYLLKERDINYICHHCIFKKICMTYSTLVKRERN